MVSLAGSLVEEATGEVGFLRRATGALPPQQPYHKATSRSEALEQQHMAPADVAGTVALSYSLHNVLAGAACLVHQM